MSSLRDMEGNLLVISWMLSLRIHARSTNLLYDLYSSRHAYYFSFIAIFEGLIQKLVGWPLRIELLKQSLQKYQEKR